MKLKSLLLTGFVVTWTMKYAGYYCGNDTRCVKALEGEKSQTFTTYQEAKNLICSLPQGAEEAAINGIAATEVCKPQPICEPCKCNGIFNYNPV